jgi:hypothetical protein
MDRSTLTEPTKRGIKIPAWRKRRQLSQRAGAGESRASDTGLNHFAGARKGIAQRA